MTTSQAPGEPILTFERGIDRASARTAIAKGGYEDAQNLLLGCVPRGAKHLCSMAVDAVLDDQVTWPPGNAVYAAPYTSSEFTNGVLSFSTHLLVVRDTGQIHRYDMGAPGTVTPVRRGLNTSNKLWVHTLFDQWLILLNGRDAPMKYGQHFFKQGEARPFLFPLGSKPVTPCGAQIQGESWTMGAGSSFVADASVPGGGSRVHTASLRVGASSNATLQFTSAMDFLSGPYPYGGSDFAGSDYLVFQVFKAPGAGAANLTLRFHTSDTAYFQFVQSVSGAATWQTVRLRRDTATTAGSPDWKSIAKVVIANADATDEIYIDDVYFLYASAPPALQVATEHKGRLVGGGAPVTADGTPALANLYWSRAGFPDEWPATNVQIISSGTAALARANRITAVREFGASVLVGTPHAMVAWTVDTNGNPQRQTITNEHGIDSHRALVETPNGAMIILWQRGIYVLRSTWRAFGAEKIRPLLQHLWLAEPEWSVGVFDELTQTLRFWWREKTGPDDPPTTTTGIVLDYVRAQELGEGVWPSRMTQLADWAVPIVIGGRREILYGRFNSPQLYRLGAQESGGLESWVVLPWISREDKDKLVKWQGMVIPYASTTEVSVEIRYANHPQEFEHAEFEVAHVLPPAPGAGEQARVLFGRTSRWAQVRLRAQAYQMEIFPPIELYAYPTSRQP